MRAASVTAGPVAEAGGLDKHLAGADGRARIGNDLGRENEPFQPVRRFRRRGLALRVRFGRPPGGA